MALSEEGLNPRRHYKTVQSGELGIGFALAVAEQALRKRYPDHLISVVDADIALQAGWALVGKDVKRRDWVKLRPDFLLEAWKPGERRRPGTNPGRCPSTGRPARPRAGRRR
ncbi:hypothetical protein ACWCQ1_52020 [Streptomyces sp. NPDC002144]